MVHVAWKSEIQVEVDHETVVKDDLMEMVRPLIYSDQELELQLSEFIVENNCILLGSELAARAYPGLVSHPFKTAQKMRLTDGEVVDVFSCEKFITYYGGGSRKIFKK